MTEEIIQQPQESKKSSRNIWIGVGIAAGVLAICLCVAAILFAVFDPLGIIARLTGKHDPIAQAAPPDTQFFMNVNLLQLQSEEFIELVSTFSQASGGEEITDFQGFIDMIDEELEDEIDMTIREDVQPWIGQFVGLGIKGIESGDMYDSSADLYLIVEALDKEEADEFLAKAMRIIKEENDQDFIEQTYEGHTIYELDTQWEDERVALCRAGGLVILTNNAETVKHIIDAQKGDSLAENGEYQTLIAELPKDRLMTFYLDPDFMETFYGSLDLPTDVESNAQMSAMEGLAMSLSATNVGIQMDVILSYDLDLLPEEQRTLMQESIGEPRTATFYPKQTYLYFRSAHLDQMLTSFQEGLYGVTDEAEVEEAMEMFAEQFGFNPQTDIFPYLDGEWALGLFDDSQGLLANQLDIPLGVLLVVESSDPTALQEMGEKVAQGLQDTGEFDVTQSESNGIDIFQIIDPYMQETLFVYGVKESFLFIGLDVETIEDAYGDRLSLEQNPRYKDGWDAFPSDMQPAMYLDVEGIYNLLTGDLSDISPLYEEEAEVMSPIEIIEVGARNISEDMYHSLLIMFVEGLEGE
jgi:hypothetical protein